ncbi:Ig-like domain-containing protein [Tropicibacter sp. R16_0]|uniref:Ig-like domain-containing protein n=1 Tax=Tropicibacter sp. R16_0 TaxID=2821102 RepID=UPI001AD99D5D|nr:Ig-like domain-containing protein [Tropicibacter sp. R16_0]MBO9453402.1 Ig-like domain-containing protein [Tropicibacter sp. R16_0]
MSAIRFMVRQAMLAALLLPPISGAAEVHAEFDATSGSVIVSGLDEKERRELTGSPSEIYLQHAAADSSRSMALSLRTEGQTLFIDPRFGLRPGAGYIVRFRDFETEIAVPGDEINTPELLWHAPADAQVPANMLRLYLMFSEPMARGQVRGSIWLERADGSRVDSPFLNLHAELWDRGQRRLTLLFDPGRIKQGVGPNQTDGAPLEVGESYRLIVADTMASAEGAPLGDRLVLPFRVGPALRTAVRPDDWLITSPEPGTSVPIAVTFDRAMDRGASARLINILDGSGTKVPGTVATDGRTWRFVPKMPWPAGVRLRVDPDLEDISGNSLRAPFDAIANTIGQRPQPYEAIVIPAQH